MLKLGICHAEQLDNKKFKDIFGVNKSISLNLLKYTRSLENDGGLSELILSQFCDSRRVYKRTYSNRFDEFDNKVLDIINNQLTEKNIIIHDVGVSDARTSCDFFHKISEYHSDLKYYASDYEPYVNLLCESEKILAVNDNNDILQFVSPPWVFNTFNEARRYYPLNCVIKFYLFKLVAPKIMRKFLAGKIESSQRISLFCNEAHKLSIKDERFNLLQYNVLKPSPIDGPLDVIRIMNMLNIGYFTDMEFKESIQNIFDSLRLGGLFVSGSNGDKGTEVEGAVYVKLQHGFKLLATFGKGHRIADIIANFSND